MDGNVSRTGENGWVESMRAGLEAQCLDGRRRHRADTIFLIVMGARVIMMQTGYAMLESAVVRQMNASNIMMKGFVDLLLGCMAWYALGDHIAYPGISEGPMPWDGRTFDYALWFLHLSYVVTAATINSAALAERVSFWPHAAYVATFVFVVYPVAVWWVWGGGWLEKEGFVDYAGSAVVHMVGALASVVSCCVVGPRIGRYTNYRGWHGIWQHVFMQHYPDDYFWPPDTEPEKSLFTKIRTCTNPVQMLYGMLSLIVGFIALSPAAASTVNNEDLLAARLTVMTLLSAAAGSVASCIASVLKTRSFTMTVPEFATATIAAAVSSCACCNVVTPLGALICGFIGAVLALLSQEALDWAMIDDPIKAASAHGLPGAWGILCVPLLASPHCHSNLKGILYGGGEHAWRLLGEQVKGLIALGGWTIVSTYICVIIVEMLLGLRCSRGAELVGLDYTEHAYDNGHASHAIFQLRSRHLRKVSLLHRCLHAAFGPIGDLTFVPKIVRQRRSHNMSPMVSEKFEGAESAELQQPEQHMRLNGDKLTVQDKVTLLREAILEASQKVKALRAELAYAKSERTVSDGELWSALRFLNSTRSRSNKKHRSILGGIIHRQRHQGNTELHGGKLPPVPSSPTSEGESPVTTNGDDNWSATKGAELIPETELQEILHTTLQELATEQHQADRSPTSGATSRTPTFTDGTSRQVTPEGEFEGVVPMDTPRTRTSNGADLPLEELHDILHSVLHEMAEQEMAWNTLDLDADESISIAYV